MHLTEEEEEVIFVLENATTIDPNVWEDDQDT